jgi:hypothetical protein
MDSPLLTRKEAMSYLRKGRTWMTEHADEIGVVRMEGRVHFKRSDLDAYIERHYRRTAPTPVPVTQASPPRRSRLLDSLPPETINPFTGRPIGSRAS